MYTKEIKKLDISHIKIRKWLKLIMKESLNFFLFIIYNQQYIFLFYIFKNKNKTRIKEDIKYFLKLKNIIKNLFIYSTFKNSTNRRMNTYFFSFFLFGIFFFFSICLVYSMDFTNYYLFF